METTNAAPGLDLEKTDYAYQLGEHLYLHQDVVYSVAHRIANAAVAFLNPALIEAAKRKEESDSLAVKVLQDAANAGAERDSALRERNAATARIADLERVLAGVLPLCVNPHDGGEFEDGEVAAVDAARASIAETETTR